jgi:hypothetical protein
VFELLPLAALLGASGFGELINRYKQVLIRKRGSREEGAARGRPKIQITGPKVQPLVCQICLGRIKEGTEYVKCGTGKVFHSVCLARTGTCPFCQRTVAIKGMESTTSVPHSLQFVFLPPEKVPEQPPMPEPEAPPEPAAPEEGRTFVCVSCGAVLEAGTASCACGAIFADPGGSFECPECGAEVREADRSCAVCGAVFEPLGPLICPGCGKEVAPDADVCECGVLLSDKCPECGAHLRESDMACAVCGAEFGHL